MTLSYITGGVGALKKVMSPEITSFSNTLQPRRLNKNSDVILEGREKVTLIDMREEFVKNPQIVMSYVDGS